MTIPMAATPDISICVLTWNQAGYIHQAVKSVVSQVVDARIEVLVGDDCSTDGTDEVVRAMEAEFPGVVKLVRHPRQLGASGNYKKLLELAQGEFIAHLDGDDYWLPGKLQAQLDVIRKSPSCSAVYTNALVVDTRGAPRGLFNDSPTQNINLGRLLAGGNFLNTSSMLFRATAKHLLLAIDEPFIDYRIHLRLARTGDLAIIADPFVVYRVSTSTSMATHDESNVHRMYWQAILDVPRTLVTDHVFGVGLADFYRRMLFRARRKRNYVMARDWWREVCQASPFGKTRTSLLVANACFFATSRALLGRLNAGVDGSRSRVLFRS